MGSQLDLDQGGTHRQYQRVWMGPSVGWLNLPVQAVLNITTTGIFTIQRWTNYIKVNVASGVVDINLPSSKASPAGPQAIPDQWVYNPVIITDLSGQAGLATTINIGPLGAEEISGLTTVPLATPYGTILLNPLILTGGWTLGQ